MSFIPPTPNQTRAAAEFAAGALDVIRSYGTHEVLDSWVGRNERQLAAIKLRHPAIHEMITEEIRVARERIGR